MMPMSLFLTSSAVALVKKVYFSGAVERLDDGARILNLAAKQPGAYFVFNSDSQLIVAAVDNIPDACIDRQGEDAA